MESVKTDRDWWEWSSLHRFIWVMSSCTEKKLWCFQLASFAWYKKTRPGEPLGNEKIPDSAHSTFYSFAPSVLLPICGFEMWCRKFWRGSFIDSWTSLSPDSFSPDTKVSMWRGLRISIFHSTVPLRSIGKGNRSIIYRHHSLVRTLPCWSYLVCFHLLTLVRLTWFRRNAWTGSMRFT